MTNTTRPAEEDGGNGAALLPCPFCGAAADVAEDSDRLDCAWTVFCTKCDASTGNREDEADAIATWSRRVAPGAAEGAPSTTLQARATDLHEKAGMPWHDAERLALSENGIDDAAVDELIGECGGLDSILCTTDELRAFTRSVLVHQAAPGAAAAAPSQDAEDAVLVRVIQRLNQNPYSLTKAECIAEVQSMRPARPRAAQAQGGKA